MLVPRVPLGRDSPPLPGGDMYGGPISGSLQKGPAKRNTVDEVFSVACDLMSAAQTAAFDVLLKEGANATEAYKSAMGRQRDIRATSGRHSQDLVILVEHARHGLEVEAFEGDAIGTSQLDHVVL